MLQLSSSRINLDFPSFDKFTLLFQVFYLRVCTVLQELWSLLEFMMPDVFNTYGVDLDQFLGTRNGTSGVVVQDRNLMTRIKGILGPFVLRRLKTDVMRQLVCKIQKVCYAIICLKFSITHILSRFINLDDQFTIL